MILKPLNNFGFCFFFEVFGDSVILGASGCNSYITVLGLMYWLSQFITNITSVMTSINFRYI